MRGRDITGRHVRTRIAMVWHDMAFLWYSFILPLGCVQRAERPTTPLDGLEILLRADLGDVGSSRSQRGCFEKRPIIRRAREISGFAARMLLPRMPGSFCRAARRLDSGSAKGSEVGFHWIQRRGSAVAYATSPHSQCEDSYVSQRFDTAWGQACIPVRLPVRGRIVIHMGRRRQ